MAIPSQAGVQAVPGHHRSLSSHKDTPGLPSTPHAQTCPSHLDPLPLFPKAHIPGHKPNLPRPCAVHKHSKRDVSRTQASAILHTPLPVSPGTQLPRGPVPLCHLHLLHPSCLSHGPAPHMSPTFLILSTRPPVPRPSPGYLLLIFSGITSSGRSLVVPRLAQGPGDLLSTCCDHHDLFHEPCGPSAC